jgi:hypothetical protein
MCSNELSTPNDEKAFTSSFSDEDHAGEMAVSCDMQHDRSVSTLDVCGVDDSDVLRLCEDFSTKVHFPSQIEERYTLRFICDLGYGLPNESRPRKEKILAIVRQLANFLIWRQQQTEQQQLPLAHIFIVLGKSACKEGSAPSQGGVNFENRELILTHEALLERMREIWAHQFIEVAFPDHIVSFVYEPLGEFLRCTCGIVTGNSGGDYHDNRNHSVAYLSPDATTMLDVTRFPPNNIIIGLLIDRRSIQHNRSYMRARDVRVQSVRLPLDCAVSLSIHENEPLNVDCVLEGMQQWCWNIFLADRSVQHDTRTTASDVEIPSLARHNTDSLIMKEAYESAVIQAIRHHCNRHPQRPLHKTPSKKR